MVNRPTAIRRGILALGLACALAPPSGAIARENPCHVDRKVGAHALSEVTWKQLNMIYQSVGEEKLDEAFGDLQKMLARAGRDDYLRAVVNQALAQVEWTRGNHDASLRFLERAVELDTLPDRVHFALMYQIAQLYFMQERHDEALQKLELWFCTAPGEEITAHAHALKASILVRKMDYAGALDSIDTAIAMDEDPREQWYQLKLAAHYELAQFPQAAEALEVLVSRWPGKKMYWVQLSQIHYRLQQYDRALAVLALAHRKHLLDTESDITYLSALYSNSGVPYKAAEVLQGGIRDSIVPPDEQRWTMIADAWYAAGELEKSLSAFEQAGLAADDGEIDLRRAYILTDLERWADSLEALDQALEKGGLSERKTGEAFLLRGIARFNLAQFDNAGADWARAGNFEETRESAREWLNHLQEERLRQ